MKKRVINSVLISLIVLLLVLMTYLYPKITGEVVKEPKNQIQMYFYDEITNCSLDGYLFVGEKPIGKTRGGYFQCGH